MKASTMSRCVCLVLALAVLAVGTVGAVGQKHGLHEGRNFDARVEYNKSFAVAKSDTQNLAVEALRAKLPNLGVTYDEKMGVTRSLVNYTGYLTGPDKAGADAMDIALDYVRSNLAALGLSEADIQSFEVTDDVRNPITGSAHIYLRQLHRGIPVYNGQLHINVNRDGRVMGVNNAFLPDLPSAINASKPALSPAEAVASAALSIGIRLEAMPAMLASQADAVTTTRLSGEGISLEDITAQQMWLPVRRGDARLVWNFQIQTLDSQHYYDFTVDANSGDVLTRFDWTNSGTYRVYKEPDESPLHGTTSRTLVVNPEDATASPSGWFAGGTMDGNNVHACPDANGNNACDSNPQCSGTTCDFPVNLNNAPSTYIPAATANLFYWNNLIHDVQYKYGFTESGGNFQENNFGNGGAGGDSVNADAQDGSGNCNANFSTPTDGGNPRMQMFTCTNASPARDGDFDNAVIVHEYGHGISIRQVGGPGNSSCLNNTQQAGEGWSDWFGLAYTAEVGDAGTDSRGIGTYLFGQAPNGPGIRDLPYSTNQSVNNWTYESIGNASIPHGVGSRWAQAIWEVYWALVADHGFSAGDALINPTGSFTGSQRAMLYVNEGLQNTACGPTFIDNRDGIIQAVTDNFGGEDLCTVWTAFANFGLGIDASTNGPGSRVANNGFNVPAGVCGGPPPPPPPPSDCPAGSVDLTGMVSYSNQNVSNGMSNPNNETIILTGNTWKRTTQTFNITANTMVEFTFSSTDQGEIHAIGFDADDTLNDEPAHCQFWGTQNWTGTGNIGNGACGATYSGSGTQTFTYPIGQFITGTRFLVLTNDDDAAASANGTFSCIRVFEDAPPPPGGCTVDDDFETNTDNWIISAASTCTTGTYVDGNPTQQTSTVVTQPAGSASGVHSIFTATNTSAGVNDVDGGNCIVETINPYAVAVPSTLSISYFHGQRDTGDDPSGDFFNIQWSSNGGATWNNVVSNGDTRSVASWTTATAQVPAGNIDIRVQCSDGAGPGDIVECGIDDLSICDN